MEVSEDDAQPGDPAFSSPPHLSTHTGVWGACGCQALARAILGAHCDRCVAGSNDEECNEAGFFLVFYF